MIPDRALTRVRRSWLAAGWALVVFVVVLSVTPVPVEIPVQSGDKYSHVLAYAVLMCWFTHLHETSRHRAGLAAAFIALGIVLEFVQRWTGYRTFDLADMAAGAAGVAAGWMLAPPRIPNSLHWLERRIRSRARHSNP